MSKESNDTKHLTPIYAIFVSRGGIRYYVHLNEEEYEGGHYGQKSYLDCPLLHKRIKEYEEAGFMVRVRHYGWKQRGLRLGERIKKPLYETPKQD